MAEQKIWSDKKRICGLPISFTKYSIENDRLYRRKGLLNTSTEELLLYRVLDVKSSQSLSQKIFGVGTVIVYAADQTNNTLSLFNVKNHEEVHRLISELVEKERENRGLIGREMFGVAD